MHLGRILILLVIALPIVGCVKRPWIEAGAQPMGALEQSTAEDQASKQLDSSNQWTGHITAYAAMCPPIPNARLQLPVVSPDAQWIAYLKSDDTQDSADSDSLITGKGLHGTSLWVRPLNKEEEPKAVAYHGASWPSWSADGRILAFVTFDQNRHSSLGIYDIQSGVIERKAVGLRCVLMPSIAPNHEHVAVCAYGEVPDQALIFIIDPRTSQAQPGPPAGTGAQLLPRWISNDTLIYLETSQDGVSLNRWTLGDQTVTKVAHLPGPSSIFDVQHLLTCINDPIRPDIGAYAYFNPAENRIEVFNFTSGTTRVLPAGFQGGSWWGDDWLVASSDDRVELVSSRRTSGDADRPRMLRALTGRWMPIWADHERQSVILVGEAESLDTFSLMQLWLVAEDE